MKRISFWKGVLAWVKLSSLMFCSLFIILALPYLGFEGVNLSSRILSLKVFIALMITVYLVYVFSYGKFKLKRRGFLLAGIGHILLVTLFSMIFYPIVGFAIAVFYLIAIYKLASTKIGCQCNHMV